MATCTFKVGDLVQVGPKGEKGKIIDVYRPLGTYPVYKVHLMTTGSVTTAARHELVKGFPDNDFQDLFDCFQSHCTDENQLPKSCNPVARHSTSTASASETMATPDADSSNSHYGTRSPFHSDYNVSKSEANSDKAMKVATARKSRFVPLSTHPLQYVKLSENKNTKGKTDSNMKVFRDFLQQQHEFREPNQIPPLELNELLMNFILSIRKLDGNEYEPSSLRRYVSSIDRYLKEKNYGTTVAHGPAFATTMQVLTSKGKELRKLGKGQKPQAAQPISDDEIEALFIAGQLGNLTPASLINTLWLNNTMHFGMRGGAEHRQLMWGDITLQYDHDLGCEFLEFNERQTKTRTGIDLNNIRVQRPRMYATGTARCPIVTYKIYSDHRPDGFSGAEDPFYLATTTKPNPGPNEQWFIRGPIGKNKLYSLMKTMAMNAGLPSVEQGKRLTNTSARKTLCQKLLQADIPDTRAIHITGHKNPSSLNNYRTLTNVQQRQISNMLAPPTSVQSRNQHVEILSQSQVNTVQTHAFPALFQNTTITGGTFNINITYKRRHSDVESD